MVLRAALLVLLVISTTGSDAHIKGDLGKVISYQDHDVEIMMGFIIIQGWHFLVAGLTRQDLGLGPTRGPRQIIGSRCPLVKQCSACVFLTIKGCRAT